VQYIAAGRSADWLMYYGHLFGFTPLTDEERFGIMPKGKLMKSPCGTFFWQLVEPDWGMDPTDETECLQRLGLGTPDVPKAVQALRKQGVDFVDSAHLHPDDRGALTQHLMGSVAFELVHSEAQP
jgi:4-hydroxyphenylpyruvate dioxygenase